MAVFDKLILRRNTNPYDANDINKNNNPVTIDEMDSNFIYLKKLASYSGGTGISIIAGGTGQTYNTISLKYDQFGSIMITV